MCEEGSTGKWREPDRTSKGELSTVIYIPVLWTHHFAFALELYIEFPFAAGCVIFQEFLFIFTFLMVRNPNPDPDHNY